MNPTHKNKCMVKLLSLYPEDRIYTALIDPLHDAKETIDYTTVKLLISPLSDLFIMRNFKLYIQDTKL